MIHEVWEDFSNFLFFNFRVVKSMPEIHVSPGLILEAIFLVPCCASSCCCICYFCCLSQHWKCRFFSQEETIWKHLTSRLDVALGSLVWWLVTLHKAGGGETRWSLWSFSTQTILWFYDLRIVSDIVLHLGKLQLWAVQDSCGTSEGQQQEPGWTERSHQRYRISRPSMNLLITMCSFCSKLNDLKIECVLISRISMRR